MPVRSGQQYLAALREHPPEVWLAGDRVEDPTSHPGLARGAASLAALYDLQNDPANLETMTYASPTSGERVGLSFITPQNQADLVLRRLMMERWARSTFGFMGRTPDYLNCVYMAFAAAGDFFAGAEPRLADNVRSHYQRMREGDLCSTHALVSPQVDRATAPAPDGAADLPLHIVRETSAGLVVTGARMLATLGPLSEELAILPSTALRSGGGPGAERCALAFSIPTRSEGVRLVCRESLDLGGSRFDHPLSSRFEEMDCVVIFQDVVVPWERVFLHGDVERCNQVFTATGAVVHMSHQVVVRDIAKAEFVLGLVALLVETINLGEFQHVQEKVAECICYLEVMRACMRAAEADAAPDQHGVYVPAWRPLNVARNLFPRWYPRLVEIVQQLGAGGLMATPGQRDLEGPLGEQLQRYMQGSGVGGGERLALFHLAWDFACSSFGGRQALYERFFFGDPVRMAGALAGTYELGSAAERVRDLLREGMRESADPAVPALRKLV